MTSSTSSESGSPPETTGHYNGPDAFWVPSMEHYRRADVVDLLQAKGFKGQTIFTGDTDPKFERDELVCEQTPSTGKIAPTGTITVKLCNTYKAPVEGPQLVGMTVDAATQKAKETGFTGKIQTLQLSEFDASCKQGNVCRVDPGRWYLNQDHEMTLYVNKTVTISTPDQ